MMTILSWGEIGSAQYKVRLGSSVKMIHKKKHIHYDNILDRKNYLIMCGLYISFIVMT